ncbi:MAG: PA2779 family protein [Candidatus Rokuibacteriota bacterium]
MGVVALAIVVVAASVARAAPIPPPLPEGAARGDDLAVIARALETRLVAAHLRALGLTPEAVEARLVRLDDRELHRMARALPDLGVGGQQRELTAEQKAGLVLLIIVAIAVFGGLAYLALAAL